MAKNKNSGCLTVAAWLIVVLGFMSLGKNKQTEKQSDVSVQPETVAEITDALTETVNETLYRRNERSELKDTTAGNIMKYFIEHDAPNLGGYFEYDEETDINQKLGKPNEYISKVGFFITSAKDMPDDETFCGTIEVFENKEDAETKYNLFIDAFETFPEYKEYLYLDDCVIIRIMLNVPQEDAETYEKLFNEYMQGETEATTEPETESETEAPTEKAVETQPVVDRNYISNHENEIVAVAKMTLDNFISGYDISLAPQLWNIALYDNDGAVMATTDITYNGTSYGYVYVGTLNLDKNGKVESATPHFVYAMGALFGDDGYCQDLIGAMNALAG